MSTKKIIRQILIGAALTINVIAISTLGQQQVNAMINQPQGHNPQQQLADKINGLQATLQADMDKTNQKFNEIDDKIKDQVVKLQELDAAEQQLRSHLDATQKTLEATQKQLTTAKDNYKKAYNLTQQSQALMISLRQQIQTLTEENFTLKNQLANRI